MPGLCRIYSQDDFHRELALKAVNPPKRQVTNFLIPMVCTQARLHPMCGDQELDHFLSLLPPRPCLGMLST